MPATRETNRALIANIRNLAGVPPIVYGILGVVVFVQAFRVDRRVRTCTG